MLPFTLVGYNLSKFSKNRTLEDWRYSSAKDFAGLRNGTPCNQVLAKRLFFDEW
jgi:hypothetical protein